MEESVPVAPAPSVPRRSLKDRIRALIPTATTLRGTWIHRLLGERVFEPTLWHITQNGVASGLAVGIFTTLLPIPGLHIIAAVAAAFWVRGNIPSALGVTLVANPFTLPFLFYAQIRVGHTFCRLTGTNDYGDLPREFKRLMHAAKPFFIGSVLTAAAAAALLYFGTHALWGFFNKRRAEITAPVPPNPPK